MFKVGDRVKMKQKDWEETIGLIPHLMNNGNVFTIERIDHGISDDPMLHFTINGVDYRWRSCRFESKIIKRGRKRQALTSTGLRRASTKELVGLIGR